MGNSRCRGGLVLTTENAQSRIRKTGSGVRTDEPTRSYRAGWWVGRRARQERCEDLKSTGGGRLKIRLRGPVFSLSQRQDLGGERLSAQAREWDRILRVTYEDDELQRVPHSSAPFGIAGRILP